MCGQPSSPHPRALVTQFRCRDALDLLYRLPSEQYLTGWVRQPLNFIHIHHLCMQLLLWLLLS
jgi:hypothetical protein